MGLVRVKLPWVGFVLLVPEFAETISRSQGIRDAQDASPGREAPGDNVPKCPEPPLESVIVDCHRNGFRGIGLD